MRKIVTLLFALICFTQYKSAATHVAGADLRYEWVANNSQGTVYRVYYTFYRDCEGLVGATPLLELHSENTCTGQQIPYVVLQLTDTLFDGRPNGSEVNGYCPGTPTRCADPGNPLAVKSYEEWMYSAILVLPAQCENWRIWVDVSNRNACTNLYNASGWELRTVASINNLHGVSSSPFFTVRPTPFVCLNELFEYNQGAVDKDGDSLSYESIIPLSRYFTPMNYSIGFNLSNPFATLNGFYLNPVTGQIRFTPTALSNNTFAVRVTEWRKGQKMGSVVRDIQCVVAPCRTQTPKMTLIEPSIEGAIYKDSFIYACVDIPLRFNYKVVAASKDAVLTTSDNHRYSIPASGIAYQGQRSDSVTGRFSWRPGKQDVGLKVLVITVRDSSCTLSNVVVDRSYSIPIIVRPAERAYHNYAICPKDSVRINTKIYAGVLWSSISGDPVNTLSCSGCADPMAQPLNTTKYLAYQDLGAGCYNTDTVEVFVDNSNSIEITPAGLIGLCMEDSLKLSAEARGLQPLKQLTCGITSRPATNQADTVTISISSSGRPVNGGNIRTAPLSGVERSGRHQYLVRKADLMRSGVLSGTLNSLAFYAEPSSRDLVYKNVKLSLLCTEAGTLSVHVGFLPGAAVVYTIDSLVIPAAGGLVTLPFRNLFNRDVTKNLVIDFCYANVQNVPSVETQWVTTPYNSVLYGLMGSGNICDFLPGTLPLSVDQSMPVFRFGYFIAPEEPFRYRWESSIRAAFHPSFEHPAPTMFVKRSQHIGVSTVGRNGCKVSDEIEVHLGTSSMLPRDTVICRGNKIHLDAQIPYGRTYKWYENDFQTPSSLSCNDCPNPEADPTSDVVYTLVIENDFGCMDTVRVNVSVVETKGQVRILNTETSIDYGSELQLMAEGSFRYEWQPADMMSNPSIFNPVILPDQPVVISVTGFSEDGCKSYDTLLIDIDLHGKIFVPNAFTPNGDGKNDVFRVANLSFQQLEMFRVVNRWGELVFETLDETKGWDGTYKGQPQEVGSYFYMIKIRFPDGSLETFKGDVTLFR